MIKSTNVFKNELSSNKYNNNDTSQENNLCLHESIIIILVGWGMGYVPNSTSFSSCLSFCLSSLKDNCDCVELYNYIKELLNYTESWTCGPYFYAFSLLNTNNKLDRCCKIFCHAVLALPIYSQVMISGGKRLEKQIRRYGIEKLIFKNQS